MAQKEENTFCKAEEENVSNRETQENSEMTYNKDCLNSRSKK